jgi:hypothetical protein
MVCGAAVANRVQPEPPAAGHSQAKQLKRRVFDWTLQE